VPNIHSAGLRNGLNISNLFYLTFFLYTSNYEQEQTIIIIKNNVTNYIIFFMNVMSV